MPPWIQTATAALLCATALAGQVDYREDQQPGTAAQVEKGKQLYAACAGCHGPEGEGRIGAAPRLNSKSYLAIVSNDFLKKTIQEGRTGTNMIPWGQALPEEDVKALVAYLRSWQQSAGIELDSSELGGELETGEKLYTNICSRCHGRSGGGYSEAGSGTGIGRKGFLAQASNGLLRALIRHGKDNTAMRPFDGSSPVAVANLTEAEIDSIIRFLRANAW